MNLKGGIDTTSANNAVQRSGLDCGRLRAATLARVVGIRAADGGCGRCDAGGLQVQSVSVSLNPIAQDGVWGTDAARWYC